MDVSPHSRRNYSNPLRPPGRKGRVGCTVEVPIFVDTNLGTRLAVAVRSDVTAGDIKRELEREHANCFPELGIVSFDGLLVKEESFFYHLPDSIPVKYVCKSIGQPWFLHAKGKTPSVIHKELFMPEARNRSGTISSKWKKSERRIHCSRVVPRIQDETVHFSSGERTDSLTGKSGEAAKPNRPEEGSLGLLDRKCCIVPGRGGYESCDEPQASHPAGKCDSDAMVETSRESVSEATPLSVSSIIERYFTNLLESNQLGSPSSSEVAFKIVQNKLEEQLSSKDRKKSSAMPYSSIEMLSIQYDTPVRSLATPLPKDPDYVSFRNKSETSQVGKRFVMAANSLLVSQTKEKPVLSLCSSLKRRSSVANAGSCVKSLGFEIGDDD